MAKIFETFIIKKVVVNPSPTGAPTFVYNMKRKFSTAISLAYRALDSRVITTKASFRVSMLVAHRTSIALAVAALFALPAKRKFSTVFSAGILPTDASKHRTQAIIRYLITQSGAFTFTVPPGVTSLTAECWGGGGGGGTYLVNSGGGGGGGGYSRKNTIAVTPGQVISGFVGAALQDSWFVNTSTVLAKAGGNGGNGGALNGGAGGAAGTAANGIGDVKFSGGTGGTGALLDGGGGGGGGGSTQNGGNGAGVPNGGGAAAFEYGGRGGNGGAGVNSPGFAGKLYSSGGGGASAVGGAGPGSQGLIRITYIL